MYLLNGLLNLRVACKYLTDNRALLWPKCEGHAEEDDRGGCLGINVYQQHRPAVAPDLVPVRRPG